MELDYKIVEEETDQLTGEVLYQRVRYYEGKTTTEDELDELGVPQPVTRYRRTALIEEIEYTYG